MSSLPNIVQIGIDPATTGTTGVAVLGLGEPILEGVRGIEFAMTCEALNAIEERLAALADPVHVAVVIEYPRFKGKGGGASTVRAAANAWQRIINARFKDKPGVLRLWWFMPDPNEWQRELLGPSIKSLGTKALALMRANDLLRIETVDHNVADAICLAEYGEKLFRVRFLGQKTRRAPQGKKRKRSRPHLLARLERDKAKEQNADSDID